VKLAEKNINLYEENNRNWGEICTHKYLFDRQDKQLELLSDITKKDLQALFELTFFSKQSKRIDLQLTSEMHAEEQELYKQKNSEHEIFQNIMTRVPVKDSIVQFKRQSGMHPDAYKASYAEFLMKTNKQV
jgi:secreted Zn-dependent insulinase-like peptidase